jgi:hypothetical protein
MTEEELYQQYLEETGQLPEPKFPKRTWGEAVSEAPGNVLGSGADVVQGLAQMVAHPIDTVQTIGDIGSGAALHALPNSVGTWMNKVNPGAAQRREEAKIKASMAGDYLKNRFGGEQELKNTLATDPVGAALDVSTIFTGGAGMATKLPRVQQALKQSAKLTNPISYVEPVTRPIVGGAKAAGGFVQGIRDLSNPAGQQKLVSKYQRYLAGENAPLLAQELRSRKMQTPGINPTSGQLLADMPQASPLLAHEKQVAGSVAGAPKYGQRMVEQKQALDKVVGGVAGTPAALEQARQLRANTAASNYGAISGQPLVHDLDFESLFARPVVKGELGAVETAAMNRPGQNVPRFVPGEETYTVGDMQVLKTQLDDIISGKSSTKAGTRARADAMEAKKELIRLIEQQSPKWEQARSTFAQQSDPINRMEAGQAFQNRLQGFAGGDNITGSSMNQFARDFNKMDTGQANRFGTLEQLFVNAPDEYAALRGAAEDVGQMGHYKSPPSNVNLSNSEHVMGEAGKAKLPNVLDARVALANKVLGMLGKNKIDDLNAIANERYLDPQKLAKVLDDVPPAARKDIYKWLKYGADTTWRASPTAFDPSYFEEQ